MNILLRIAFSFVYVRILSAGSGGARLAAFVPSRSTLAALALAFLATGEFLADAPS